MTTLLPALAVLLAVLCIGIAAGWGLRGRSERRRQRDVIGGWTARGPCPPRV